MTLMKAGGSLAFINDIDEGQRGGGQRTPGNGNREEYFTDPTASSTPSGQSEETLRNVKSVQDAGSWFTLAPEGQSRAGL